MDIFSFQFLYALGAIVLIDLVLAGDNAIVIALAARNLPPELQKRAVVWGTVGAVVVRSLMTLVVVWLLKIPGLLLAGGALLLWIAFKLLLPAEEEAGQGHGPAANSFWGAMKTIVIADAVMGLDNVLAVAGAAQGQFLLIGLGLMISIPIVVWGSTLILQWVKRFPVIIDAGAAVLAFTAAKMMLSEPLIQDQIQSLEHASWGVPALCVVLILGAGRLVRNRKLKAVQPQPDSPLVLTHQAPSPTTQKEAATMNTSSLTSLPAPSSGRRILIAVDGSPQALHAVRTLSRSMKDGDSAHLLYVAPRMSRHITRLLPKGTSGQYFRTLAGQAFAPAEAFLKLAGRPFTHHFVQASSKAPAIHQYARELDCQLIVVGSCHNSAMGRWLSNSVTADLLAISDIPVEVILNGKASGLQGLWVPAGLGAALLFAIAD